MLYSPPPPLRVRVQKHYIQNVPQEDEPAAAPVAPPPTVDIKKLRELAGDKTK